MENVITNELKRIKDTYLLSYDDIQKVLDKLKLEEHNRKNSNEFTIDLEGDFIFKGTFHQVESFIKNKLINNKKINYKDWQELKRYGLTTPTTENLVLVSSYEFHKLFETK